MSTVLLDAPTPTRTGQGRPPIAHLENELKPGTTLCGTKLKRKPAPATDPCIVCLTMVQGRRFLGR